MNFLRNKWVWLTMIFLLLTPFVFQLAYMERGYRAVGGEMFFPLIPFLIYATSKTFKEIKEVLKGDAKR